MPTEYMHQLRAEGAPDALARLRGDGDVWQAQLWRSMYGLHVVEDPARGTVTYRFDDDHKRPGPSAADVAAAHSDLTFIHEFTDEFGQIAGRQRYVSGLCVEDVRLEPAALDWVEWEEEEE